MIYTVKPKNNSLVDAATSAVVTVTLPSGVTYVSKTNPSLGVCSGSGPVLCSWTSLPANTEETFTITVTVN